MAQYHVLDVSAWPEGDVDPMGTKKRSGYATPTTSFRPSSRSASQAVNQQVRTGPKKAACELGGLFGLPVTLVVAANRTLGADS